MMVDCGLGEGHRPPDVCYLKPSGGKIRRRLEFGKHAGSPLPYNLRNELVRVEQLAAHSDEQTSLPRLTRIMRHVGYGSAAVANNACAYYPGDFADCHSLRVYL